MRERERKGEREIYKMIFVKALNLFLGTHWCGLKFNSLILSAF